MKYLVFVCLSVVCLSSPVAYAQSSKSTLSDAEKYFCLQDFISKRTQGAGKIGALIMMLSGTDEASKNIIKKYNDKNYIFYDLNKKKIPLFSVKEEIGWWDKNILGYSDKIKLNDDWVDSPLEKLVLLVPRTATVLTSGSLWIVVAGINDDVSFYFPAKNEHKKQKTVTTSDGSKHIVYFVKIYDKNSYCLDDSFLYND